MRFFFAILLLGCALVSRAAGATADIELSPAEKATADATWEKLIESGKLPEAPPEWKGKQPSPEQITAFREKAGIDLGAASEKFREFYLAYPSHPKALESQKKERSLLEIAIKLGQTNRIAQLKLNPILTDEDKFEARMNELHRKTLEKRGEGMQGALEFFEKGLKDLLKEFPGRDEIYEQLVFVAERYPIDKKLPLAREIAASNADEITKEKTRSILEQYAMWGKKIDLKFTAVDGRKVDLAKMEGKVVLVDFWATWCAGCLQVMPFVRHAYKELHDQGFEVVGISHDRAKSDLTGFIKQYQLPWPQHFDDEHERNSIGARFGIHKFPTMWLIDKKGILREVEVTTDVYTKVKQLLAEK